ncbi:TetR/AcrR family transcriptional regulator [Baekduia sp. Peel2402]|uniref:TetR/AcrR family transcriptional regulator n=1 Tax=Baekduia sp. Peel2402 TaxID=3458296 RepID=UPI00403EB7E6
MSATARPYHHGNLREALLVAGERALGTTGAANLSLRELAREVGVSHAAPRRHFADRQALLDALALNGFEQLGAQLDAALAGAGEDFTTRILALARAYVGFATTRPALIELMFASKHEAGAPPELAQAADRAFAAALAVVADGQAAGAVVPGDPERLAKIAFALLQGLVAIANNDMLDDQPLDALRDAAVERLLLGFAPR